MQRAGFVRGRLVDSRHIVLDEPIEESPGEVEVLVRVVHPASHDVAEVIRALPPGTQAKDQLDKALAEDRESWGDQ